MADRSGCNAMAWAGSGRSKSIEGRSIKRSDLCPPAGNLRAGDDSRKGRKCWAISGTCEATGLCPARNPFGFPNSSPARIQERFVFFIMLESGVHAGTPCPHLLMANRLSPECRYRNGLHAISQVGVLQFGPYRVPRDAWRRGLVRPSTSSRESGGM